eukprot:gene11353-13900_t
METSSSSSLQSQMYQNPSAFSQKPAVLSQNFKLPTVLDVLKESLYKVNFKNIELKEDQTQLFWSLCHVLSELPKIGDRDIKLLTMEIYLFHPMEKFQKYHQIGGVTRDELNRLEISFLYLLKFDCSCSHPDYLEYFTELDSLISKIQLRHMKEQQQIQLQQQQQQQQLQQLQLHQQHIFNQNCCQMAISNHLNIQQQKQDQIENTVVINNNNSITSKISSSTSSTTNSSNILVSTRRKSLLQCNTFIPIPTQSSNTCISS